LHSVSRYPLSLSALAARPPSCIAVKAPWCHLAPLMGTQHHLSAHLGPQLPRLPSQTMLTGSSCHSGPCAGYQPAICAQQQPLTFSTAVTGNGLQQRLRLAIMNISIRQLTPAASRHRSARQGVGCCTRGSHALLSAVAVCGCCAAKQRHVVPGVLCCRHQQHAAAHLLCREHPVHGHAHGAVAQVRKLACARQSDTAGRSQWAATNAGGMQWMGCCCCCCCCCNGIAAAKIQVPRSRSQACDTDAAKSHHVSGCPPFPQPEGVLGARTQG
jgi:hypothetical protein